MAVAACQSTAHDEGATTEVDCPAQISDQVRLAASAVPLTLPTELAAAAASTHHPNEVVRRLTISVAPGGEARGLTVFSSTLSLMTTGGTLAGWAGLGEGFASSNAVDITPGRLRIQPFLRRSTLEPQTMVVDLLVVPGSAPIDESAVKPSVLWDGEMRAKRPDSVQIGLTPLRHFNVLDKVNGRVILQLTVAHSRRTQQRWNCSFEGRFELVDHDAVLPDLWGLRVTGRRGAADQWFALADPTSGAFRAIFTDAQIAHSFAAWLRTTKAAEVGRYKVGLFQLEPDENTPPAARRIPATPFHPFTAEDLQALEVKRLGE
jgi:hypothetical protein